MGKRLAAGRARALGVATRGTTKPNRLRRMDNWITSTLAGPLRGAADPLVVDLGYGASPVTAVELTARLRRVRPDIRVIGLEIDPERVEAAEPYADPPWLTFDRGGFELAGHHPALVRAGNVLRQYDEHAAHLAWLRIQEQLAAGGFLVEGTCDELGRLGSWVLLDSSGPLSLTLACRVSCLDRPAELAARLPKALIHRNVPGEPIFAFLRDLDSAWDAAAPLAAFGPRQRWIAACRKLAGSWPVEVNRAGFGELGVRWTAVS